MSEHSAENDAGIEYRVMFWSDEHHRWFSHTGTTTNNLTTADAWLEQASYRGGRSGRTAAHIEQRDVGAWCRVDPSWETRITPPTVGQP